MRKQIKYRVMGLTMILAVLAGGSVQSFAEAASKESQDAKQDSLPQGLEWLTPFDLMRPSNWMLWSDGLLMIVSRQALHQKPTHLSPSQRTI